MAKTKSDPIELAGLTNLSSDEESMVVLAEPYPASVVERALSSGP
jgi:hypothetical protein